MSAEGFDDMPELEESAGTSVTLAAPTGPLPPTAGPPAVTEHAVDINSDDDDDDDEDWEEMEGDSEPAPAATCLFCPHQLPASELVSHCRSQHLLDLAALAVRHTLDSFGYIRLVNFVRSSKVTAPELEKLPSSAWADQAFMKPVIPDDPLLMIGEFWLLWAIQITLSVHFNWRRR